MNYNGEPMKVPCISDVNWNCRSGYNVYELHESNWRFYMMKANWFKWRYPGRESDFNA